MLVKYRFPWSAAAQPGIETMSLLGGSIAGSVRASEASSGAARFRARLEPFEIGTFDSLEDARNAVDTEATKLVNEMLAIILPDDVKKWLTQP